MAYSTSVEFEELVPNAGFSFADFGAGTQTDVEKLKDKRFPDNIASRFQLQGLWDRHPRRIG